MDYWTQAGWRETRTSGRGVKSRVGGCEVWASFAGQDLPIILPLTTWLLHDELDSASRLLDRWVAGPSRMLLRCLCGARSAMFMLLVVVMISCIIGFFCPRKGGMTGWRGKTAAASGLRNASIQPHPGESSVLLAWSRDMPSPCIVRWC